MAKTPALELAERFYSIQGESTRAGLPCVFIRLAGCNLRCSYCDARYTYEEPATSSTVAELVDYAAGHPTALVEITGGEPLLQEGVYPLMDALLAAGRTVLLETNGSVSLARVPAPVIKIVDVKCPASSMQAHFLPANLTLLAPHDELKFVLSTRDDYLWARDFLAGHGLLDAPRAILFSPVQPALNPAELAAWLMEDNLPVRLQLQLHKILWPTESRGV